MTETITPEKAKAPAPSRSTGSLTLAVGLLAIPVSVYAGVEDASVSRQEWTQDSTGAWCRVGRVPAVKFADDTYGTVLVDASNRPDYSKVIKRIETSRGLVDLSDDEIGAAMDVPNGTAEIVCFQPLSMMNSGAYVPESIMQVRPSHKADALIVRAFALLLKAMRVEGVFALVRYCLRGQMRYGALMSNGRIYCLRFDNEVRDDRPLDEPKQALTDDEVMQGRMLVTTLTTSERVLLTNDARERVLAYAEAKAEGTLPEVAPVSTEAAATGLMDTLRASVEAAARAKASA